MFERATQFASHDGIACRFRGRTECPRYFIEICGDGQDIGEQPISRSIQKMCFTRRPVVDDKLIVVLNP